MTHEAILELRSDDARTRGCMDVEALVGWLAPRIPGVASGLRVERMDGGQSNPSWLLQGADQSWVLRAKPAPAARLLASAHAIEREYRVLAALQGSAVPVPPVRALCEDESVIGVAFYVMDFVQGRIFRDATLPEIPAAQRGAYFMDANRVLAALHLTDWRDLGLQDFGRHDGYYSRLISRWTQQYQATVDEPNAAMEHLIEWLPQHIPAGADEAGHTCITHGDFRMENLMFHPTRPEVVAVLDWELSTLGHSLSDLAYNCLAWHMPAGILRGYRDQALAAQGLPLEADYIVRYCERAGLDCASVAKDWPFYLAFNLFRLSAILQGIGQREREGTASSASAGEMARMSAPVARWGWAIARGRRPEQAD
ncbi:MAG TPA: phosphotransferase [Burkholderiales bacterium]|nr:phosphotransferase [Burkholderiales bacterium]